MEAYTYIQEIETQNKKSKFENVEIYLKDFALMCSRSLIDGSSSTSFTKNKEWLINEPPYVKHLLNVNDIHEQFKKNVINYLFKNLNGKI